MNHSVHREDVLYSRHDLLQKLDLPSSLPSSSSIQISSTSLSGLYDDSLSLRDSETTIRVLDLQAIPDPTNISLVTARLRRVDLKDRPKYTTLSYAWGEQNDSTLQFQIVCNGHLVKATSNCWSALWGLRNKFGLITIWVDSICINQDDEEEKNIQIARMGMIYSSAQVCYVWLGERTDKTDVAMDYLAKGGLPFSTLVSHNNDGIPSGYGMALRLTGHLCRVAFGHRVYTYGDIFDGLDDILSRPWIKRLWTLQEAVLSQDLVLVCGQKSITWIAMVYAIEYLNFINSTGFLGSLIFPVGLRNWTRLRLFWLRYRQRFAVVPSGRLHTADRIDSLDSRLQLHKKSLNKGWKLYRILYPVLYFVGTYSVLFSVVSGTRPFAIACGIMIFPELYGGCISLWMTMFTGRWLNLSLSERESDAMMTEIQTRQCIEPKDKYKGLFGVIGGAHSSRAALNSSESLGNTYQQLFIDLLHFTDSLDILLLGSSKKFPNLPSWVIDWRTESTHWINARSWIKRVYFVVARDWPQFKPCQYAGATPGSKSTWEFRTQEQLVVHGQAISSLSWCSLKLGIINRNSTEEDLLRNLESFQIALSGLEPSVQRKVAWELSCFVETRTNALEGPAWSGWSRILGQSATQRTRSVLQQLKSSNNSWPPLFRVWNFHMKLSNIIGSEGMVLVRCDGTHSGFGLAPSDAREGDIVALISGVSMPVILRESRGGFKLIGPTFLPGTMDGELWKKIDTGNLDELVLI